MKFDKEYPATHSMSTPWYIADEDGNVGIMNFEDNGPVPRRIEETITEDLVFGYEEKGKFQSIKLTDNQIYELIESPHSPKEERAWIDVVVKIDKNQEKDFLLLARNPDIECHEISNRLGLYTLDEIDCFSYNGDLSNGRLLETSSLYNMLEKKMILEVYKRKDFTIWDVCEGDNEENEYNFTSAPYFIYAQPYLPDELAERLNIPSNPVTIDQFPEELKQRIFHIPIKFRECKRFQIAQWIPCACSSYDKIIDGFKYNLLPLTDGTDAYIYTDNPLHLKSTKQSIPYFRKLEK